MAVCSNNSFYQLYVYVYNATYLLGRVYMLLLLLHYIYQVFVVFVEIVLVIFSFFFW